MKLPELKEKLKSKYIVRVVAGVLTIALVGTGIGATAVFAEKDSTAVTAEADSTTGRKRGIRHEIQRKSIEKFCFSYQCNRGSKM